MSECPRILLRVSMSFVVNKKTFTFTTGVKKQGSAESHRWSFSGFEKMRGVNSLQFMLAS